jgi:hypothetical protein
MPTDRCMDSPSPAVRKFCEQRKFSRFVRDGGIDYLLRRWTRIVAHVEEGYHGIFEEYLNDMDARRIMSELLPIASDEERARAEAVVPELDERFFKVTVPVDSCIWGPQREADYGYRPDHDWWYYRLPIDVSLASGFDRPVLDRS